MSFEYYIAADRPIPEIKLRGQEILTVSDMIRLNVPDGFDVVLHESWCIAITS